MNENGSYRALLKVSIFLLCTGGLLAFWVQNALTNGALRSPDICSRSDYAGIWAPGQKLQTTKDGVLAREIMAYYGFSRRGRNRSAGLVGMGTIVGLWVSYGRNKRSQMASDVIAQMKAKCGVESLLNASKPSTLP